MGNSCSNRFLGSGSWWGTRSSDDIVTVLGGSRRGRSRVMTRGIEMSVLDVANRWSFIRPGHESSVGSVKLIRRWGLTMGSIPGSTHW